MPDDPGTWPADRRNDSHDRSDRHNGDDHNTASNEPRILATIIILPL